MISRASFIRKVIYAAIIVALYFPMYEISRPSFRDPRDPEGQLSEGGVLAGLRNENRLSQAVLGEIDPASESMKLATLGMRGVAANLLWERATRYKREHDWDSLAATLNQISKLQPNFISVWQFQGWNLAYNVSIEFDDYRSRYQWVKRGIDFYREGLRYNTEEPVLDWEVGWTFGHKMGKSDEYVQFRRLYRDDKDYHQELATDVNMDNTLGPDNRPDNWLTGRQWFLKAEQLVDRGVPIRGRLVDDTGRIKRGKTPLLFHSYAPKWLISHAVAIEEEGFLDETAQYAWLKAGEHWNAYGDRPIPTSYGFAIRLNDGERMHEESARLGKELDRLVPGVREQLIEQRRTQLSDEERNALNTPPDERTMEQNAAAYSAQAKLDVTFADIAERAPENVRREVQRLVRLGREADAIAQAIDMYREQVNYVYWKDRCEIEQTDTAIRARKLVYEADQAYQKADLEGMREKYEQAWEEWAKIFEQYPEMLEDTTAEDLVDEVKRYQWLLAQLDEPWPPPGFKLQKLMERYDQSFSSQATEEDSANPEERATQDATDGEE